MTCKKYRRKGPWRNLQDCPGICLKSWRKSRNTSLRMAVSGIRFEPASSGGRRKGNNLSPYSLYVTVDIFFHNPFFREFSGVSYKVDTKLPNFLKLIFISWQLAVCVPVIKLYLLILLRNSSEFYVWCTLEWSVDYNKACWTMVFKKTYISVDSGFQQTPLYWRDFCRDRNFMVESLWP